MSSTLVAPWHHSLLPRESLVLFDQLTFKSLLQDHKEETPDKGIQDRSTDLTPILSLAVDALVHSPDVEGADPTKIKLSISDFELKHLERRVTGDLFSSAKKKYSCNFDGLTLDTTCSTSFEVTDDPKPLAIFDQVFGRSDEPSRPCRSFEVCLDSPLESPLSTTRETSHAPQAQGILKPKVLRLADYIDDDQTSQNLSFVIDYLKAQIDQRNSSSSSQNCQGYASKANRKKTEGRFSLF
jgi:hypothetical protein